jgi:hypothetical protein
MSIKKPYVILPTDSKQARQIDEMFGILFEHLTSATVANVRHIVIPSFGSDESVTTGDGTIGITIPEEMNNYVLTDALCSVYSPSTTGNINVQLRHSRAGTDVDLLTDKIVILEGGYYDKVSHINKVVYKGDIIFPDIDLAGSGTLGLFTVLSFKE